MTFSILFLLWTAVLAAAWIAPRGIAIAACAVMLALSVALFAHHVTDPLALSF